MYQSFSLYKIEDNKKIPFSSEEYSKFKFGDGAIASKFGQSLASEFIQQNKDILLSGSEIVVVPSPYNAIPTASYWMSAAFIDRVNHFLASNGLKSLLTSKIHRYKTYSADYGNMTYEQRLNLISGDTYHLDKSFLEHRICLFIDDIKITGSHEKVIRTLITDQGIEGQFIFIYFAELINKEVDPTIENELNYYYVKTLEDLISLIVQDSFVYNTRVIKYILKKEPRDLEILINSISFKLISELVRLAISNNYHVMPEYEKSLQFFIKQIKYGN
ncbi:MAG: hypothetical protein NTW29_09510 [Bacteroidetes bacterium]|nr:hypothetical protein [Bacteroidota bacterium]